MAKSISDDITERVRAKYDERLSAVQAYLSPTGPKTSAERRRERIAADPLASEVLARGYGVMVSDEVAKGE